MSHDSNRTRIWFPMFSYFESSVDGIIPNEYTTVTEIFKKLGNWLLTVKDLCMLTARRIWIPPTNNPEPKKRRRSQSQSSAKFNNLSANMNGGEKIRRSMVDITTSSFESDEMNDKKKMNGEAKKEN